MPSVTAIRGMLRADSLRMSRDRFLVGITIYIIAVATAMRWLIPVITTDLAADHNFDFAPYHPLLMSYLLVQLVPMVPGIIGGFLLLESREDGTVKALLVAPNPLSSYLFVLCTVMFMASVTLTVAEAAIIALGLPTTWAALIAIGLAGGMWAPVFALLIAAIANNKVQAFAYMKLFGIGPIVATGAYFVPEPWQWLTAIYPPYCASKAYWVAAAGGSQWPFWVVACIVTSAVWLVVLQRLYKNAARR